MFLGLTVATIIGFPLANWLGQYVGWRWGFALAAFTGLLTVALLALLAPKTPASPGSSPLRDLGALKHGQVWLTLAVGAIGFGGLFRSDEHTSDLQSLMRTSYAVFCFQKQKKR